MEGFTTLGKWALQRAREPSSYAGLGLLLSMFHVPDSSSFASQISMFAMGTAGIIALIMKEKGVK